MVKKFERSFNGLVVDEIFVLDGSSKVIAVIRHSGFQLKNFIGIFVDFIFRRRGEPHLQSVEVAENILILIVDAAMCLIENNQVEMTAAEKLSAILILGSIDAVYHGLICRKYASCPAVTVVFTQIGDG